MDIALSCNKVNQPLVGVTDFLCCPRLVGKYNSLSYPSLAPASYLWLEDRSFTVTSFTLRQLQLLPDQHCSSDAGCENANVWDKEFFLPAPK